MGNARYIDSKLYTRCPVCNFEERHLVSCVVGILEASLDTLATSIKHDAEERNLLIDALHESVSTAGHDALIGHWSYLNAVLDPIRRGQLVEERLKEAV